ncbi:MAG TPA: permease prefix domain 1-containing protein [Clostridia bacterium]|nr:permease prefix domain 1-containing protein [Clostridia bacterium]
MELNTADAYLNEVLLHVRWKREHNTIRKELSDHISDARRGFLENGMEEGEAERLAVLEMGNAAEIGARFDAAYRPPKNYGVWIPFALIIAIGLFFRSIRAGILEATVFTFLLPVVFAAAYFVPFPRLVKFAWPLYGVYLLSLAATFLGPLVGESFPIYIYYPPMFFPALYALLIYKQRGRGAIGILLLGAALLAQMLFYFFLSGVLVAILVCICVAQLVFAVLSGWFTCKKWLTALILLVPMVPYCAKCIVAAFPASDSMYLLALVKDILSKTPWFGMTDISLFSQIEHVYSGTWRSVTDFFLVFVALRLGRIIFVIVGGLFAAFFAFALRSCFKQKSMLYRLASLGITLHLFMQFIGYFLTNLGLAAFFAYPLPFVSDGNAAMLCNAALMGLLFSILYNGALVDDSSAKKYPRWRLKLVKEEM